MGVCCKNICGTLIEIMRYAINFYKRILTPSIRVEPVMKLPLVITLLKVLLLSGSLH